MDTLRHDEYIDKNGRKRRRLGSVPRCTCCGALAKVLMEIGRYRNDWMIKDCETCSDYVCDDCCDTDAEGRTTCTLCLETEARQK